MSVISFAYCEIYSIQRAIFMRRIVNPFIKYPNKMLRILKARFVRHLVNNHIAIENLFFGYIKYGCKKINLLKLI